MNRVSSPARHDRQGYLTCCQSGRSQTVRPNAGHLLLSSCLTKIRLRACGLKICPWPLPSWPT